MKKEKKCPESKRKAGMGGAFGLVDSINEYARRRSSLLPEIQG